MKNERMEDVVVRLGTPVAVKLGYELVDVEYRKEGANWVLRCFIDATEGIGITDCQRFSQALELVLDAADPIPGSYLLEVSSPGVERPLKKIEDYRRFAGKQVRLRLHQAVNQQKNFQGVLLGVSEDETQIRLRTDTEDLEIPRAGIAKANLVEEFFAAEERGKGRK